MKEQKKTSKAKWFLIGLSVVFLGFMLVLPLCAVLVQAFRQGMDTYIEAVADEYTVKALLLTLEATAVAVIANTVFGLFAAWNITKFQFRGKKILTTLIDVPVRFRYWKLRALLYGVVLCTARAMGEFGAVSVLSDHLKGKTNTLPLHIEILFNEFKYIPAFAVSTILVFMAVLLLIIRSFIEYRGRKKEA